MDSFGTQLKTWRAARHLSQLTLAMEADVSSRHISFLESGRANPSRSMVMHLSEILEIPNSQRNILLEAAGFAPRYVRSNLTDAHMESVKFAMDTLLAKHNPYPGLVMDKLWRIVSLNDTARKLLAVAGLCEGDSLLEWTANTDKAAEVIENWAEVGHHAMTRLRNESRAQGGISELDEAATLLSRDERIAAFVPGTSLSPVISTIYIAGPMRLPLFSTYAHFGGAEDLSISDLKIELMFPANPEAEQLLRAL